LRGLKLTHFQVLEPWITPSIFDATGNDAIVDEWTFGELQDNATAYATLKQHWDAFYTEQDFKDIAADG
jgi:glucan 1,3-beta-glucosidase